MFKQNNLIIGAGLAGSFLAWRLQRRGHNITLVDRQPQRNTSRTAAGLINPVTGKRLVKTPGFDHLFEQAIDFYRQLSNHFEQKFFFELPMMRLFRDEKEQTSYQLRLIDAEYTHLLGDEIARGSTRFNDFNGGVAIKHCGYLDTNALLNQLHEHFTTNGSMMTKDVSHKDVKIEKSKVSWQQKSFDRVIFCEGYHLRDNPWFAHLPLQPAKGEILSLLLKGLKSRYMINRGQWLVPRQDGSFRFGASHYWQPIDEQVNQQGVQDLLDTLPGLFASELPDVTVKSVEVGVRPATRDRQPLLGRLKTNPQLLVFNGFGAKGSLMIPWYSDIMSQYIDGEVELPQEVNIDRFAS